MPQTIVPSIRTLSPIPGGRLYAVELRKLVDSPAMMILLAAAVLLAGVTGGGAALMQPDLTFGGIATMSLLAAPYLLAILGILLVTGESSHRTAVSSFLLMPRRGRVLGAKAAAVATLGLVAGLLALPAAAAITLVAGAITGRSIGWSFGPAGHAWLTLGLIAVALIGWALGLALDNAPAAIAVLLVWSMLSRLIATASDSIAQVMPYLQWDTVFTLGNQARGTDYAAAAGSLVVWLVLPGIVGWSRQTRREIG